MCHSPRAAAGTARAATRDTAKMASSTGLQVVYFGVRAKAEALRMCLAHGRITYTDETVESFFGRPWPEAKKAAPYGQVRNAAGRELSRSVAP